MRSQPVAFARKPIEQRRRILGGIIADKNGNYIADCVVRDLSDQTVEIGLSTELPLRNQIYLVDTRHESAYLAAVVRTEPNLAGLAIARSFALNWTLPAELTFLGWLFVDAKVAQFENLVRRGLSVEAAISIIGLTKTHLELFAGHANTDRQTTLLLHQLKHVLTLKHELSV